MRSMHLGWIVAALAVGVALGSLSQPPVVAQPQPATAQPQPQSPPPQFQVSAFAIPAMPGQPGGLYGCYTVDQTTGATWLTLGNAGPTRIADSIRR